jgi:hypothetical protein
MSEEIPGEVIREVFPMDQIGEYLIARIKPLIKARIVFAGFDLPEEFGGSTELEFGNIEALTALGIVICPAGENTDRVGQHAALMGKEFVIQAIEDLFIDDLEETFSPESLFCLEQKGDLFTVTAEEAE